MRRRGNRPRTPADRRALRGGLAGVTVAVLAVAAHGLGGGGFPGSSGSALLVLAAALSGVVASAVPVSSRFGGRGGLLAILAAGQLAGHEALGAMIGHGDCGPAVPSPLPGGWMLIAHALATMVCAVLITAAERLYSALSQAIRAALSRPVPLDTDPANIFRPRTTVRGYDFHHSGALGSRAPPISVALRSAPLPH